MDTMLSMLQNLQQTLTPVWQMLVSLCYLSGVILLTLGVFKFKKYGQMTVMMSSGANLSEPMSYFIAGLILLFFPFMLDSLLSTFWGSGYTSDSILAYQSGDNQGLRAYLQPIMEVVEVVGLGAFIRGVYMLSKTGSQSGSQQNSLSKGLMHMLGGVLAININGTIDVLRNSFGVG